MRYRVFSFSNVMVSTAMFLAALSATAAPDFPSEQTVQILVRDYVYSQNVLGSKERKRYEPIYYFNTPNDRKRYEEGAAIETAPGVPDGPRFLGDDGIPYPAGYELFRPEDVIVVPPPEGLSDDAEPMAVVFFPDWTSGENHYYNGPSMFKLVHIGDKWFIRFDTYIPTPKESRDDSDAYMVLQEQRLQANRANWANASGGQLQLLRRQYLDRAKYAIAGYRYALQHNIGMANTNKVLHPLTHERVAGQIDNFDKLSNMSNNDFRKHVLTVFDDILEVFAENRKKTEQGDEYMKQQDLKRQHP